MINHRKMQRLALLGGIFLMLAAAACKKPAETVPDAVQETGTVTDIEGNVYKTVKIGKQWWMAENLRVKKYRNGKSIREAQKNEDWTGTAGAFCVYDNRQDAPGLLYNGYAVSDTSNLAPAGWHIPGDEEWQELEKHLGMSPVEAAQTGWRGAHEGEKLKAAGLEGWKVYGNVWANNESGFTALAGNCRIPDGTWGIPSGVKSAGFWWTSTPNEHEAWYRHLDYKSAGVFRYYGDKSYAFSIRCVKDENTK